MTTTFDYTEEEKRNPIGNNSLSPRAKFFQSSLYKEAIYPEDVVKPLDSWYDKNLFGRFDQDQNVIVPISDKSSSNTVRLFGQICFALNFVNRALLRIL